MSANCGKSVRFCDEAVIYDGAVFAGDVPASDLYYSSDNCQKFEKENHDIATRLILGQLMDDNINNTLRGIELNIHYYNYRKIVQSSVWAVLNEQCNQRRSGKHDPMAISSVYLEYGAQESQSVAIETGKLDHKEALKLNKQNKKRSSIMKALKKMFVFKSKNNKQKDTHIGAGDGSVSTFISSEEGSSNYMQQQQYVLSTGQ